MQDLSGAVQRAGEVTAPRPLLLGKLSPSVRLPVLYDASAGLWHQMLGPPQLRRSSRHHPVKGVADPRSPGSYGPSAAACIRCQWSSAASTTNAKEDRSAVDPSAENFTWSYTTRTSSSRADERAAAPPATVSGTPGVLSVPANSKRASTIARRSESTNIVDSPNAASAAPQHVYRVQRNRVGVLRRSLVP